MEKREGAEGKVGYEVERKEATVMEGKVGIGAGKRVGAEMNSKVGTEMKDR